jgi:hypothetical protein
MPTSWFLLVLSGPYCLSNSLLRSSVDFRLENGSSTFAVVSDSVVALGDGYLLSAFCDSRCPGERLHGHLATERASSLLSFTFLVCGSAR